MIHQISLNVILRFLASSILFCNLTATANISNVLDGVWAGTLMCSESLANRSPGFTVNFELPISSSAGRAERTDANSSELFIFQAKQSGEIELQSTGRLKSDTGPRWTTRFNGRATSNDKLELNGQMYAGDARTLVRERCSAVLQRISVSSSRDYRTFSIREVSPKSVPLKNSATSAGLGGLPRGQGDSLYLPEDWLIGDGLPWHYRSKPKANANTVVVRSPNNDERKVIDKATSLMQRIESRVIVLLSDGEIIDVLSTGGINFDTRLLSASMAKTVTALAAGKALCAGKITLDKRADSVITTLQGKDLGAATLKNLLLMASRTLEPSERDYVGTTPEESRQYLEGTGNLEQLLSTPRHSAAQQATFGKIRPGERYSYKSRDPYTVAMLSLIHI
jgi:hypothetical protein